MQRINIINVMILNIFYYCPALSEVAKMILFVCLITQYVVLQNPRNSAAHSFDAQFQWKTLTDYWRYMQQPVKIFYTIKLFSISSIIYTFYPIHCLLTSWSQPAWSHLILKNSTSDHTVCNQCRKILCLHVNWDAVVNYATYLIDSYTRN